MDKKCFKPSKVFGFTIIFASLFFLAVYLFYTRGGPVEGINPDDLRYYRAVLLVQGLDNLANLEVEEIPSRIRYHDSTESLLHQHDPRIRLMQAAEDLTAVRHIYPKARLYEAYARWQLGEKASAEKLMSDYLAYAPFEQRYYAWLAHILRESRDYASLYLIAREWVERSGAYTSGSAEHIWAALQSMGRYEDAHDFLLSDTPDFGWKKEVMLAKTLKDLGLEDESHLILKHALTKHEQEQMDIEFFWQSIKDQTHF